MKQILIGFIGLGLIAGGVYWWASGTKKLDNPQPIPPTERAFEKPILGLSTNEDDLVSFTFNDQSYRMTWMTVDHPDQVEIGINQDLASQSGEIKDALHCQSLTSGSYYGTNNQPLGMIVNQGKVMAKWQDKPLLNGIFTWDGFKTTIGQEKPNDTVVWAVQSGPIVWNLGKPVELQLNGDQAARRILAGVTTDNKLVLMAVMASDSLFGGPNLADIPAMLTKMQSVMGVSFQSVINLDGGRASAFLSNDVSLKELKPIGSYICVK